MNVVGVNYDCTCTILIRDRLKRQELRSVGKRGSDGESCWGKQIWEGAKWLGGGELDLKTRRPSLLPDLKNMNFHVVTGVRGSYHTISFASGFDQTSSIAITNFMKIYQRVLATKTGR